MTTQQKAIVRILKTLGLEKITIIGIILTLKKKHGENMFIEYLKELNPKETTEQMILQKCINL